MGIYNNSYIVNTLEEWIGRSCKPSDKGKLTTLPRFIICQQNKINVSNMLRFEELPEVGSKRWFDTTNLEGEIWKDVVGYEGSYMVSNYGRVLSLGQPRKTRNPNKLSFTKQKILRGRKQVHGYMRVSLHKDGKLRYMLIHRLVALAFFGEDNGLEVDHINFNREDNRLENLRYLTRVDNMRYAHLRNRRSSDFYREIGSKSVVGYIGDKEIVRYNSIKEFAEKLNLVYQSVKIQFQTGDIKIGDITYHKNEYKNKSIRIKQKHLMED